MAPLAPLSELEIRLGLDVDTLSGVDKKRADAALKDASALVRAEARQDFLDTNGVPNPPEAIVRVVLGAALRTYRNPNAEIEQTVGPFDRTIKSSEVSVYLTEAEKAIVRRYRPSQTSGLWTLRTTKGFDADTTVWVDDQYGTEPFPIGIVGEL